MGSPVVGGMNIVLAGDNLSFSQAMDQAQKRIDQLTANTGKFGRSANASFGSAAEGAERFGRSSVSSMQAASGALRELNGNFTNNIRAVERLLTMVPGLGNALKFAFPVIGAAAFAGMIYEGYQRLQKFVAELNAVPKAIDDGFGELHRAAEQNNDALAISNDRLQMEIDKLEKKPSNGLQLALDEARQSADKLSDSLAKDITKVTELLEKNKVGFWGRLLTSQEGTGDSAKIVTDVQSQIDAIRSEYQGVIDNATDTGASKQNIVDIKTAEMVRLEKVYGDAHAKIAPILKSLEDDQYDWDRSNGGMGKNQKANINILRGFDLNMTDEERTIGQSFAEDTLGSRLSDDKGAKQNSEAAQQAARAAAEKQRKDMEAQAAALKNQFADDHNGLLVAEMAFWESMLKPTERYSDNRTIVLDHLAEATQGYYQSLDRMAAQAVEQQRRETSQREEDARRFQRLVEEVGREDSAKADAVAGLVAANAKATSSMKELTLAHDVATGTISRYDAAIQMAQFHQEAFKAQIDELQRKRANNQSDGGIDDIQRETNDTRLQSQIVILQGESQRTEQQDKWHEFSQSGLGGAITALQEFVAQTKDSASQMKQLTDAALNDVNGAILKDLTSKNHWDRQNVWKDAGKSFFTDAANTSLKKGEGALLGGLSGGKLGTKSNPTWVRSADGPVGGASGAAGLISGAAGGKSGGSAIDSIISSFIPGFANGVENFPGGVAMVGERGPELLHLPPGSSVTPNRKLPNMGGDIHTHMHIDARGSSNPAQFRMIAQQEIRAAAPHIASATAAAIQNRRERTAPSMRR